MSDDESRIDGRTALKGAGVAGAALATGGLGLAATTGGAVAVGSQNFSLVIETGDGNVKHVSVHGDSVVSWFDFDRVATHFDITITLDVQQGDSILPDGPQQIHKTDVVALDDDSWGGPNEVLSGPGKSGTIESAIGLDGVGNHDESIDWAIVQADFHDDPYGLPQNPVEASHLSGVADGENEDYRLLMANTYAWYDTASPASDADEIHVETFETVIDVTVENLPAGADVTSGPGGVTGGGNNTTAE